MYLYIMNEHRCRAYINFLRRHSLGRVMENNPCKKLSFVGHRNILVQTILSEIW